MSNLGLSEDTARRHASDLAEALKAGRFGVCVSNHKLQIQAFAAHLEKAANQTITMVFGETPHIAKRWVTEAVREARDILLLCVCYRQKIIDPHVIQLNILDAVRQSPGKVVLCCPKFALASIKRELAFGMLDNILEVDLSVASRATWSSQSASALSLVEDPIFSMSQKERRNHIRWLLQTLSHIRKGTEFASSIQKARVHQRLAMLFHSISRWDLSEEHYDQAINLLVKKVDAQACRSLAWTYYYASAIRRSRDEAGAALDMINRGVVAADSSTCEFTKYYLNHQQVLMSGSSDRVETFLNDNLVKWQNQGRNDEVAHMLYHIGVSLQEEGRCSEALDRFHDALKSLPVENLAWRADLLHQIASAQLAINDVRSAEVSLKLCWRYFKALDLAAGMAVVAASFYVLYCLKQDSTEARSWLEQALALAKKFDLRLALPSPAL
jgi:tetratricopeptide (TPR) repeat protein